MHRKVLGVTPNSRTIIVRGSDGQYCFRRSFFYSVTTITHEPLHLARWSFAWTCALITARNTDNFKVIGPISSQNRIFGFFTIARHCGHDNSWTAARSLMKFYVNMYCTLTTSRTILNYKVKLIFFVRGPKFTRLLSPNVGKIVVDNAVFRLSIAWSVPEIFGLKSRVVRNLVHCW